MITLVHNSGGGCPQQNSKLKGQAALSFTKSSVHRASLTGNLATVPTPSYRALTQRFCLREAADNKTDCNLFTKVVILFTTKQEDQA